MKNLICIMCPMGCELTVNEKTMSVSGNNCIRGEQYAKSELIAPKRIVTALVKTKQGVLPCKTTCAVDKKLVMPIVNEINKLMLKTGKLGDVVIKNVLNSGADVVITSNLTKYEI